MDSAPITQEHTIVRAVVMLGLVSMVVQLVLFRELLSVFYGNELILGILLGNWLLLTGLGAAAGRLLPGTGDVAGMNDRAVWFLWGLSALVLLPLPQVFWLRTFSPRIFGVGVLPGPGGTFLLSLVLLAPFCVPSGAMLAGACSLVPKSQTTGPGRVYVADGIGGLLGGLLFTVALIPGMNHVTLLLVTGAICLVFNWPLFRQARCGKAFIAISCAFLALLACAFLGQLDQRTLARQYPGQKLVFYGESPYGRLVVTESAGQLNSLVNGTPVSSTQTQSQNEEAVHYAMAQRPAASRVLVVSGALAGLAQEVLKYPVREITCLEPDPTVITLARKYGGSWAADERVRFVVMDARRFIQRTDQQFDVIMLNLADPSTAQLNRFYTVEFYREVRRVLAEHGVLSFSLGGYENYMSDQLAWMIASAHHTLGTVFKQILVLPGMRTFFLASNEALHSEIPERLQLAGIKTSVVLPGFWKAMITPDRLADVARAAAQPADLNRDFSPILYLYFLRHWLSQHEVSRTLVGGVLLLVLVLSAMSFRRHLAFPVVFLSGFTAAAIQLVLLLAFQVLAGSMYRELGIVCAMFMAGIALGAWWANRRGQVPAKALSYVLLALALTTALLPAGLAGLHAIRLLRVGLWVTQVAIPAFGVLVSLLVGMVFPLAFRAVPGSSGTVAASVYAADFLGAFVGATLSSVVLAPVWGLNRVSGFVALANLVLAIAVWIRSAR
jgi:spermidine synthase